MNIQLSVIETIFLTEQIDQQLHHTLTNIYKLLPYLHIKISSCTFVFFSNFEYFLNFYNRLHFSTFNIVISALHTYWPINTSDVKIISVHFQCWNKWIKNMNGTLYFRHLHSISEFFDFWKVSKVKNNILRIILITRTSLSIGPPPLKF